MKKIIIFLLRIGVSGGILYFIFTRPDLNFQKVIGIIQGIQPFYLYSAFLVYGVVLLLGSLRWKVLLEAHQIRLTFPRILQIFFVGLFFNNFLPSLTGGDIIRAYYVSRETSHRAGAVMTIIVDRGMGWFSLFFLGAGASLLHLRQAEIRGPVLTVLLVFVISLILIILAFHNRRIFEKIFRRGRGNPQVCRIKELLEKLYQAFYFYKSRPWVLAQAFLLSLLLQTLMIVINYQIALGLGVRDIGIAYFFIFIPLVAAISSIPISVAGWGVGEMAYKKYFAYVGLAGGISVSISLALRLILLVWSLIGLPLYLLYRSPEQERILPNAKKI